MADDTRNRLLWLGAIALGYVGYRKYKHGKCLTKNAADFQRAGASEEEARQMSKGICDDSWGGVL